MSKSALKKLRAAEKKAAKKADKQKKQQEVVEQQQQDEGPDVSQGKYGVMKMVQSTEKAGFLFEFVFFVILQFLGSSHY